MYQGIYNENEFYSDHYLHEVLSQDLKDLFNQWDTEEMNPAKELGGLRSEYLKTLERYQKAKSELDSQKIARPFLGKLIHILGYESSVPWWESDDSHSLLPLFSSFRRKGDGFDSLLIFDLYPDSQVDGSILDLHFSEDRYTDEIDADKKETARTMEELISSLVFRQENPPRWVLLISLEEVILIDRSKWGEKRTLRLNLREIYDYKNNEGYRAFCALLQRESLVPGEGESLLDRLNENSHKHAFSVSEDLKYSLREAIELIGNEAVQQIGAEKILAMDQGEDKLSKECLRYMYRLLFLFYIEARPELGYAPMADEIYTKGYSLESLRDLAEGPEPETEEQQKGLYLDRSIKMLFRLIVEGYGAGSKLSDRQVLSKTFRMQPLKSHLFDPKHTPFLNEVKFPNAVLHKVLELMSLSRSKKGKKNRRGRISYVQLGINQLGAVYEGLLSYRGFIAPEELFEVKSEKEGNDKSDLAPAIFVTRKQLAQFNDNEKMTREDGSFKNHPKHNFIYRLTGRDREKSASYYTPEVLTQCLVKYSLKELLKEKSADEILNLTVCEPAMGSAAFLNEGINQLAEEYLIRKQKETGETIPHHRYTEEKQRVKSYMANRNVYGVDLNPVAVELGEVSLWLNTIFSGGFVPWFGFQLRNGNSLIGARRETLHYSSLQSNAISPWHQLKPERNTNWKQTIPITTAKIFHWLLPDPGMADYKDKVVKQLAPEKIKTITDWRKKMLKPFSDDQIDSLRKITNGADKLWLVWVKHLASLKEKTTAELRVFGQNWKDKNIDLGFQDTIVNHEVMSHGRKNSSEYLRLKLAMDYWCALWFWPLEKADLLPSREGWLNEMSLLLTNGDAPLHSHSDLPLFEEQQDFSDYLDELGRVNVPALIEGSPRLKLVRQLASQYKFFHWELEFADIFAHKGGFDLILGNPPWVKVEWNESGVLGEKEPIIPVKGYSANKVVSLRPHILSKYPDLEEEYLIEYQKTAGIQNYLNGLVNFPELKKIQTNLYKCFLPLSWRYGQAQGVQSFVHPEGVYDDPKGGSLRKIIYPRLRYHFQFQNAFLLFSEIPHREKYSINIYSQESNPCFTTIGNLFTPQTVDLCYSSHGLKKIEGIKNSEGNWNLAGHTDRIIDITLSELQLFAKLYDAEGVEALEARLPAIHAKELIKVLEKFASYPCRLGDLKGHYHSLEMWHETNAQNDGTIKRQTIFPKSSKQWMLSGPHFYVGNPYYKTPRTTCIEKADYDILDLTALPDDYRSRTNYVPNCSPEEYEKRIPRVPWNENGQRRKVTDHYRLIFRRRLPSANEHTLIACLIPPDIAHIHTNLSFVFQDMKSLLTFSTLSLSIFYDFFIKITGKSDLYESSLNSFPLFHNDKIELLGLSLYALQKNYESLWEKCYSPLNQSQKWLKMDRRLSNDFFRNLTPEWNRNCALRTDYERRQALVEIDVLVARELGITLEELIAIYRIQFPVLRQNEQNTWYDTNGRIVYTFSKGNSSGLPNKKRKKDEENGISYGVHSSDRQEEGILLGWENVKDLQEGDWVTKTWMDDTLPGGPRKKTVTYYAPFDRCDREEDYREVWKNLDNNNG